jgi:hypothetical protein
MARVRLTDGNVILVIGVQESADYAGIPIISPPVVASFAIPPLVVLMVVVVLLLVR